MEQKADSNTDSKMNADLSNIIAALMQNHQPKKVVVDEMKKAPNTGPADQLVEALGQQSFRGFGYEGQGVMPDKGYSNPYGDF